MATNPVGYARVYATTRTILTFLFFVGWVLLIGGVFFAIYASANVGSLSGSFGSVRIPPEARILSALPGIAIAISGLFAVAYSQVARAQVDAAEMTREMLNLLRKQTGVDTGR